MGEQSLGSHLKEQRKKRRLSLEAVAEETKIAIYMLRAMEKDQWELLPAEVFIRGFPRSYAEVLGLDPDEVVQRYCKESGLCDSEEKMRPLPNPIQRPTWYQRPEVMAAVIFAAIVISGVAVYLLLR